MQTTSIKKSKQKEVALPKGVRARKHKYPFADMEIGDSFFIKESNPKRLSVVMNSVGCSWWNWKRAKKNKQYANYYFTAKEESGGVRVWRIAAQVEELVLKVEKGIPIPDKKWIFKKERTQPKELEVMSKMRIGDTMLFPFGESKDVAKLRGRVSNYMYEMKGYGKFFTSRLSIHGVRIWRVKNEDGDSGVRYKSLAEIVKEVFYKPAANGKVKQSISEGMELIKAYVERERSNSFNAGIVQHMQGFKLFKVVDDDGGVGDYLKQNPLP